MKGDEDRNDSPKEFLHVHACVHCGHVRRREEIKGGELAIGILNCPNCGLDGPLNVEIREQPAH